MTGPANKRQKREDYRKAQQASGGGHDGGGPMQLPKKKFYRQRAHANPFSDHNLIYPTSPSQMQWSSHFPAFVCADQSGTTGRGEAAELMSKQVEMADVGCGFGGLLVALSPVFPDTLMIGMELRTQVLTYIHNRILALRSQTQIQTQAQTPPSPPSPYQNISALRTNTMKHLPNFFHRHQLTHLFLCFPDPHFKARKHKARIVSTQLCAEYAFVVRPGGRIYTITDVEELAGWIRGCFEGKRAGCGDGEGEGEGEEEEVRGREREIEEMGRKSGGVEELWERVSEDELERDPCVRIMREETEEGKKVTRNGGRKFVGVWTRKEDPAWPDGRPA